MAVRSKSMSMILAWLDGILARIMASMPAANVDFPEAGNPHKMNTIWMGGSAPRDMVGSSVLDLGGKQEKCDGC